MYNDEHDWMIFSPNPLGLKNVNLHSSLYNVYLLLVHKPIKWIAVSDTLILKLILNHIFYDIFNMKQVKCTLKMSGIYE